MWPQNHAISFSEESPIVNVAFVVKDWGRDLARLKLNGETVTSGRKFRLGHNHRMEGVDLIVWIETETTRPLKVELIPNKVQTSCEVGFDDLGRFVQYWLGTEGELPGDLDGSGNVDFYDYARLADLWPGPCPPGWPLKE